MGGWGTAKGNTTIFFKIEVLMNGSVKSRKQSSKPSITYWNLQKIYDSILDFVWRSI